MADFSANIFFTIVDGDDDPSRIELPIIIPDGLAFDDVAYAVGSAWTVVNALLTGSLRNAGFSIQVDISGYTNPAASAVSDVQEKALFGFRTENNFPKKISIPTFVETLFNDAGASKTVNLAATEVAAFTTMIEDGIPDAAVAPTLIQVVDSHGDDVVSTEYGVEDWGKRRR